MLARIPLGKLSALLGAGLQKAPSQPKKEREREVRE